MVRNSSYLFIFTAILLFFFIGSFICKELQGKHSREKLAQSIFLVKELGLTDLALFTEARYTRHVSQADRNSAFQDHPMAFDHFPTGSIVQVPFHLLP